MRSRVEDYGMVVAAALLFCLVGGSMAAFKGWRAWEQERRIANMRDGLRSAVMIGGLDYGGASRLPDDVPEGPPLIELCLAELEADDA